MSKRKRKTKANPQFPKAKGRTTKNRFEKLDNIHYYLFIGFGALYVLHHGFIEEQTIGYDERYKWYIFILPTFIGALLLVLYQWKFLGDFFSAELKGWTGWFIRITFSIIISLILSYLSFGNIANIVWDYVNTREAKMHMPETLHCPITDFAEGSRGRNNRIYFNYKGEHESVRISRDFYKTYRDVNPSDYELDVIVRKGIWDYYVVEDWNIKSKVE